MSSTIFDGVIANFAIENIHYEKLNLWSKLISKFYIHLHAKVGISLDKHCCSYLLMIN